MNFWKFIHNIIAHPLLELPAGAGLRFHDWSAQKAFGHLYYIWWLTSDEVALATKWFASEGPPLVFYDILAASHLKGHGQILDSVKPGIRLGVKLGTRWDAAIAEHCSNCVGIVIEAEHLRYLRTMPGLVTTTNLVRASE